VPKTVQAETGHVGS